MTRPKAVALAAAALVVVAALVLRGYAVAKIPQDWDEDNYLRRSLHYAQALRTGNWAPVMTSRELEEHPALGKLVYGLVLAPLSPSREIPYPSIWIPPDKTLPQPDARVARGTAAALGTVAVGALALADPLAALLLAVHTWNVKYTSEIYLEAQASLFAILTVLAYLRSGRRRNRWLVVSGVALGLTLATKYVYGVVGIAIALDWLIDWLGRRRRERRVRAAGAPAPGRRSESLRAIARAPLTWVALTAAAFFVADFYLWPDPIGRLAFSLVFHERYALGESVRSAALPPGQPLIWLAQPVPAHDAVGIFRATGGHKGVFLVTADSLIGFLALMGLPWAWQRHRVFVLWLLVGIAFLIAWPTKWPQYTVLVTAPLAVVAADAIRMLIWEPLTSRVRPPWRSTVARTPVAPEAETPSA
jgi:hypothetical protein